jgi:DNA-binding SARP family transcriptional activator
MADLFAYTRVRQPAVGAVARTPGGQPIGDRVRRIPPEPGPGRAGRPTASTGGDNPQILNRHAEISAALSQELLPDWCDDWLLLERERWDQARLHALETLARQLMSTERFLPALEAALVAVAIEPIRESAHRAVIEIHLAEGNSACAMKHYQRYRGLLHRELGVAPSRRMIRLIEPLSPP